MKNQIKLLAIVSLALLSVKNYCQSTHLSMIFTTATHTILIGGPTLTAKDKQNSEQFKAAKGSERVEAFKKIESLILTNTPANVSQASKMGITPSTKADIQMLMGEPDIITVGGFWEYYLKNASSSCKVVLGFNKNAQVIFYAIKNCQ